MRLRGRSSSHAGAVGEIKRVTEAEGIACDWADGGQLIIARGTQQRPAVDDEYQTMQRLGLADGFGAA